MTKEAEGKSKVEMEYQQSRQFSTEERIATGNHRPNKQSV
jgi:hypothetical protein